MSYGEWLEFYLLHTRSVVVVLWEFKETKVIMVEETLFRHFLMVEASMLNKQCFRFEMVNDAPDSSEDSEGYDADDARPTFV